MGNAKRKAMDREMEMTEEQVLEAARKRWGHLGEVQVFHAKAPDDCWDPHDVIVWAPTRFSEVRVVVGIGDCWPAALTSAEKHAERRIAEAVHEHEERRAEVQQ